MPTASAEQLLIFTRHPEPGNTKTRLIPCLGRQGAADLQRRMTEHLVIQARKLRAFRPVSVRIRYEGGTLRRMETWLGSDLSFQRQGAGDIGRRMARGFESAFDTGADRVVIVGTDIPGLTPVVLDRAFKALVECDLVLGPACDGGYYLIGLNRAVAGGDARQLFQRVCWGQDTVLKETLKIADQMALKRALLETLDDVDRPEDLAVWERYRPANTPALKSARISVIIPSLNEADQIVATLGTVANQEGVETIVADGGSSDATVELASGQGAKVISSPPPRSRQMNAAAAAATGEIYLFLHADTRLPPCFARMVRHALADSDVVAGAFSLKIGSDRPGIRLVEWMTNARSRRLSLPYGDQAIFLAAARFWREGGFPLIPIMEDFALVRRLAAQGRIAIADAPVVTSGRRWDRLGIVRTTLINQLIIAAYHLGASPETIARWYRRGRTIGEG